ncbi:SDR family oxidoreductase [Arthrobacter gandavensis]|uniref:NAD(P)-dependent oxidoreductase n=1 Tax=Arthrobacter gandavensis TaxID=169960 RepID=UPI00188F60B2|nr:NAD(P)-binding oxidoreductase [Arthrobacter gandavensis]MBF4993781.1 SDR family oxidoreductase [Arthrobacter gandavensis]
MKLTIIGGSKGTGARLASLAQAAGHDVTVLSRSGQAPAGVRVVAGDAGDPGTATSAISGADAVVITVGGAKGSPRHRAAVTRSVIEAMKTEGVRRLMVQSSLGAGDSGSQLPSPLRVAMKVALAKPLADHNEQEAAVQDSGLDWTIVRPTGLTDKEPAGSWQALQTSESGTLRGSISRADLAACMLELLEESDSIGKAVGVSS